MKSIHIQMMIGSETVHIPELRPLIGQTVDIVVTPTTGLEAPTDWLPDFWEKIKKGWQGEPLVRPDQGVCEVRDKLR